MLVRAEIYKSVINQQIASIQSICRFHIAHGRHIILSPVHRTALYINMGVSYLKINYFAGILVCIAAHYGIVVPLSAHILSRLIGRLIYTIIGLLHQPARVKIIKQIDAGGTDILFIYQIRIIYSYLSPVVHSNQSYRLINVFKI